MTFTPPAGLTRLIDTALTHGRSFVVQHQTDTDDNPYVTITIRWPGIPDYQPNQVVATWHTRGTGTYRLMHVTGTWATRDHAPLTLTKALQFAAGAWTPLEVADILADHQPKRAHHPQLT